MTGRRKISDKVFKIVNLSNVSHGVVAFCQRVKSLKISLKIYQSFSFFRSLIKKQNVDSLHNCKQDKSEIPFYQGNKIATCQL